MQKDENLLVLQLKDLFLSDLFFFFPFLYECLCNAMELQHFSF